MKKINKIVSALMLTMLIIGQFSNIFAAFDVQSAFIEYQTDCGDYLQVNNGGGNWGRVITSYVEYQAPDGQKYPAYCLDNTKPGVGSTTLGDNPNGYTVNVEKLLDNDRIYTAIINGYPYKTPEELGVSNKYDAFTATKHAVYSIINGTDINSKYRGVGDRGQKIINAMNNIVYKANHETKRQTSAMLTLVKDGAFGEDANQDYYSQTYHIQSDVDMQQYTITGISEFTSGSYIVDLTGNRKNTFSAGEQFKIMIPKEQANNMDNVSGAISVQAKCKTYPVFYASKDSSVQPYALTFSIYGNTETVLRDSFNMRTGKIVINKTDAETSKPIEGVTFQLQKKDGTVVGTSTTDSRGVASFSQLLPADYVLKETSTNENYVLNKLDFDVNVKYNQTVTKSITNEHKRGNLKVIKVDKDNHKIALGNVQFDLYSEEFGRIIGTYTTNVDGEIQINNLRTGKYKLIEKNTRKMVQFSRRCKCRS